MTNKLQIAFELAEKAHEGQFRHIVVEPYIEHPKRVAKAVARVCPDDVDAQCAALLHDAVEDSGGKVTIEMIREQLGHNVAEIVALVTHDPKVSYATYVNDLAHHPVAREIKRADILDNMATISMDGRPRWSKYINALSRLSYAAR